MENRVWRWILGLIYILAVASIWIAASFVVQSVVDGGVSPFLVSYICNSLFIVLIPLVEIGRYLEDTYGSVFFWRKRIDGNLPAEEFVPLQSLDTNHPELHLLREEQKIEGLDSKGRWTRMRMAKVSLLICPFWFLAQLTFNLSLKYTSVTSNTILSSVSSLFTFVVALVFLGEKFTWIKLISVILCMGGTIIVSLADSGTGLTAVATNPLLGDGLALVSSALYAIYITLIRKNLPDEEDEKSGKASMAQFLGFLGLFNLLIFLPVAVILSLTHLESFNWLTWNQLGLIVGKGLMDNVLSDYLWAKAVLLTTTTVATAGLTIQVPLAAIIDTLIGNAPNPMDYIGASVIMVGFVGINIPSDFFSKLKDCRQEELAEISS